MSIKIGSYMYQGYTILLVKLVALHVIIFKCRKYDHVTPLFHHLVFKILTIVYKCLHNTAPKYLTSLIMIYQPGRPGLCSGSDSTLLAVPKVHSAAGDRASYTHAPPLEPSPSSNSFRGVTCGFQETSQNFPVQWLIASTVSHYQCHYLFALVSRKALWYLM